MRECIGLRSLVSVFGGEGEHPVPAPGKADETKRRTSSCGRGAEGQKSGRPGATRTTRVDVKQDGPKVRN